MTEQNTSSILGHLTLPSNSGQLLQTSPVFVSRSVCLYHLFGTTVSAAEAAEMIEMLFGLVTLMATRGE